MFIYLQEKKSFTFILLSVIFFSIKVSAQEFSIKLNDQWSYAERGSDNYSPARVPGSVYSDLVRNNKIPDPLFADNEKHVQWVDSTTWIYQRKINLSAKVLDAKSVNLIFHGLDTYASVYLNDELVLVANNMFRKWTVDIKKIAMQQNILRIVFDPALLRTNAAAQKNLPQIVPEHNRVYARKAQFQFGWDWGPTLVNCGIWKNVYLNYGNGNVEKSTFQSANPVAKLIQKKEADGGESFYFEKNGKAIYAKGANWIPAHIFLDKVKKEDYKKLLMRAKEANMNMLRVWGGGIYESDYFYELCDELGIMVWQDFMFAGGMVPGDKAFIDNVREEVKQQVNRLKKYKCVVLWCGNNEIDEAWNNWGWQKQFNLHGADSAKIYRQYKTLFEDSIPAWVNKYDGKRAYIPSSPRFGWGKEKSYTEGDSHFWGLWWGLQPWEAWDKHTGRFVSEYGMQAAPSFSVMKNYIPTNEVTSSGKSIQWHQKANGGNMKLNFYIDKYFMDTNFLSKLSLEEYSYVTQSMQYYILQKSISIHTSKMPHNMGTLLWQLNNCWPATSWSILNYDGSTRGAYFAVKKGYAEINAKDTNAVYPKNKEWLNPHISVKLISPSTLRFTADKDADFVFVKDAKMGFELADNYFSLKAGKAYDVTFKGKKPSVIHLKDIGLFSWYNIVEKLKS